MLTPDDGDEAVAYLDECDSDFAMLITTLDPHSLGEGNYQTYIDIGKELVKGFGSYGIGDIQLGVFDCIDGEEVSIF